MTSKTADKESLSSSLRLNRWTRVQSFLSTGLQGSEERRGCLLLSSNRVTFGRRTLLDTSTHCLLLSFSPPIDWSANLLFPLFSPLPSRLHSLSSGILQGRFYEGESASAVFASLSGSPVLLSPYPVTQSGEWRR